VPARLWIAGAVEMWITVARTVVPRRGAALAPLQGPGLLTLSTTSGRHDALMGGHGDRLPGFVAQADDALPLSELPGEGAVRVRLGTVVVAGHDGHSQELPASQRWRA
jgi:hypothetical protein